MKAYDLLIVGAGPTGISVAIAAQKAGFSHLIIERGPIANALYHFPLNMTFFSTSEKLEVGGVPFISHTPRPTRSEALEYYRRLVKSYSLNIEAYSEVKDLKKTVAGGFEVSTSRSTYAATSVVLATGFYGLPRTLNVPGEDLPKVRHYFDDPHLYIDQKVLVVGAANSACDVALETWMKGADVTMAVRGSEIYEKVKYWIKPNIENRIAEGSIKAHFNTTVAEIREGEVDLNTPDGIVTIANDFVLAMTGYKPDYTFLESCGVQMSDDKHRTPRFDAETLESGDVPGLYLAGVINAGMATSTLFIENTRHHGDMIVKGIEARVAEVKVDA
ncbi:MAG: YpdA family putative bacillithiol disulfide reductase [Saprospiraceae bacterium]